MGTHGTKLEPDPADRGDEVHHLQVKEMEEAELVLQTLPAFHQGLLVAWGPIGHRNPDPEPSRLKEGQEPIDVALGVARGKKEGHGEVVDGIGRDKDRPGTIMDLVDAEDAREVLQHPRPVSRPVDLPVGPFEAVVDEADGHVQAEVFLEVALNLVDGEMIPDQEVDHFLSDRLGVARSRRDPVDSGGEELGAPAGGGIDPDHEPP
jgi:hypothetical protein